MFIVPDHNNIPIESPRRNRPNPSSMAGINGDSNLNSSGEAARFVIFIQRDISAMYFFSTITNSGNLDPLDYVECYRIHYADIYPGIGTNWYRTLDKTINTIRTYLYFVDCCCDTLIRCTVFAL